MSTRPTRIGGAALVAAITLSGCAFQGLYEVSLPGGAELGDDPYHVTVEFADVLDLVPQSGVRVNDVPVGRVEEIRLVDWHAEVRLAINGDVDLPANARAEIRQTSLLGEKFVSLSGPANELPRSTLGDGDHIPLSRTGRNPEVEEILSALSLLLNGGGLEHLQEINQELGDALDGREGELRDLLEQLNTFIGGLDEQKSQITRAIDSIDQLAATLAGQRQTIATALETLPGALQILADQRESLTTMLQAVQDLGQVGVQVITATRQDLTADLAALRPVLSQLAAAGSDLPNALELLLTYPFPKTSSDGIAGDYTNLYVTVDLDATNVLDNLVTDGQGNVDLPPLPPITRMPGEPGAGGLPGLPQIPGVSNETLPGLPVDPPRPGVPGLPDPGAGQDDEVGLLPGVLGVLLGGGP